MNRICVEIRHDGSRIDFDGDVLAQVRGQAPADDPHSDATGVPEVIVYRTAEDKFVITCDSVETADPVSDPDPDPGNEEIRRSVAFGQVVRAQEMTDPWIVNTATDWDVPLQVMQEACNSCRDSGAT